MARAMGRRGGRARAKRLSAERRRRIASMGGKARHRSFLAERQILSRLVSMARELGKKVIAEGVETADQLRMVREVGCEQAQGFFFTPPLDVIHARTLLQGGVMDVV